MRIKTLLLCVAFTTVGCGSSSPENFIEASARLQCRFVKKCLRANWNQSDYDNVRDCVDDALEVEVFGGMTVRDAFLDSCEDFDSSAARECLAGMRKAVRKCDQEAPSRAQERACRDVCGSAAASALFSDPTNRDFAITLLEELEAQGE